MGQHPDGGGPGVGPVPALPDFEADGDRPPSGPLEDPVPRSGRNGRLLAFWLGGAGVLLIGLLVVALVLWLTVLRPAPTDPTAAPGTSTAESTEPREQPAGEYIPGDDDEIEPTQPEITFSDAPTTACTLHHAPTEQDQPDGAVRGGPLEYDLQPGWSTDIDWGGQTAYLSDVATSDQYVENSWFSVASIGAIDYPEAEGGYPGAEAAARAIFQCGISGDLHEGLYGTTPDIRHYRDEAITVDGHDAWIVSATIMLANPDAFSVTDSWDLVVIVVDTPQGPAGFEGGAATGMPEQVTDLAAMVESLRVA